MLLCAMLAPSDQCRLLAATTVTGRDGNTATALPYDEVARLLAEAAPRG